MQEGSYLEATPEALCIGWMYVYACMYGVTAPCPEGGITAGQGMQHSKVSQAAEGLGLLCNSFMPVVRQARLSHHRQLRPIGRSLTSALISSDCRFQRLSGSTGRKIGASVQGAGLQSGDQRQLRSPTNMTTMGRKAAIAAPTPNTPQGRQAGARRQSW